VGLFSVYVAYRIGRKAGRRRIVDDLAREEKRLSEVCKECGFERRFHARDAIESCPV